MTDHLTRLIVGLSEKVQAEYSYRADGKYTVLEMYDGEAVATEGFNTLKAALAETKEAVEFGVDRTILI
jgi:hypothetical protein